MHPWRLTPWVPQELRLTDEQDLVMEANDKLEVLSHKRNLNKNLKSILDDVRSGNFKDLEHTVLAMHGDATGIETYLSKTIETKYYPESRPSGSTAAAKVFAIPELVEAILPNLKAPDLMQCYGVNRMFRDVIDRSDKLQMLLFLKTDPNSEGADFPFESKHIFCTNWFISFKGRAGSGSALPSIGSRWKRMFTSHPSIHYARYQIVCEHPGIDKFQHHPHERAGWNHGQPFESSDRSIQAGEGLTIGDLYEAAKPLLEEWSDCTKATFAPGGDKSGHEVVFWGHTLDDHT